MLSSVLALAAARKAQQQGITRGCANVKISRLIIRRRGQRRYAGRERSVLKLVIFFATHTWLVFGTAK
jgi:hypothetical protein